MMQNVPVWLPVVFGGAILLPVVLLARMAREAAPPGRGQVVFWAVAGTLLVYFGYVVGASLSGLFDAPVVPPAVLRYATLPYALLLIGVVFGVKPVRAFVQRIPTASLIRVHRFRVVGATFLLLAYFGALPVWFGLIAGFGDLLTALSSPWVARAVAQQRTWAAPRYARSLALVWNTFGLLDIAFTAIAANVLTYLSLSGQTNASVEVLGTFPFCLIPAFAPPTIAVLHVLIFRRLQ
jgi:hypothetical protein